MAEHDGMICSDFLGGDWAECKCGWRSDTLRNPTEAKLAHEQHLADARTPDPSGPVEGGE